MRLLKLSAISRLFHTHSKQQPLESDSLALHAVALRDFNEQMDSKVLKLQAECSKMSDDLANAARAAHKLLVFNLLSLESSLPPPVTNAPPPSAAPVVSSLSAPPATTTDEWSDTRSIDDDDPADDENGFFDAEDA